MTDESKRGLCIIVGAGEGLGRALAARFARGGCDIALVSRAMPSSAAAFDAVRTIAPQARVCCFTADVSKPQAFEAALHAIAAEMGPAEVVIYNVRGRTPFCAPLDMTYQALEEVLALEVVGAFAAARAVMLGMIARGRGTVIYSSATAAFRGSATHPLYSIGKFGLRALSQSLAKSYAASGVHVAHVRLDCSMDVPLMRGLMPEASRNGELANPDAIAESYWWIYRQPSAAWSNEIELRPNTEHWTF
jgi:NAD(P)-dependent dehydrogenase (short-subunit alcohol dehydrogenase family)